jgi:hypothetical protein
VYVNRTQRLVLKLEEQVQPKRTKYTTSRPRRNDIKTIASLTKCWSVGVAFWFRYWPSDRDSGQTEEVIVVRMDTHRSSLDSATSCFPFSCDGPLTGLLYQPQMMDVECGAVSEMTIDSGNWNTRRKPAPVPLCPLQIPHDLTWPGTRTAAVGSQCLTTWAVARARWEVTLLACKNTAWEKFFLWGGT